MLRTLITTLLIASGILALSLTSGMAHPGGTDATGCHTNRTTGQRHCHNASTPKPTPSPLAPKFESGTVISTGDGDTLRVNQHGKSITIRMACIDAAEQGQKPWGAMAANRLKSLLPQGQEVMFKAVDQDRYGRTVAEVWANNQLMNVQMVSEGMAAVHPQYIHQCDRVLYQWQESLAKKSRVGIWDAKNPLKVMPWDYRKRN